MKNFDLYDLRDDCEVRHLITNKERGFHWEDCKGCEYLEESEIEEGVFYCGAKEAVYSETFPYAWDVEFLI